MGARTLGSREEARLGPGNCKDWKVRPVRPLAQQSLEQRTTDLPMAAHRRGAHLHPVVCPIGIRFHNARR